MAASPWLLAWPTVVFCEGLEGSRLYVLRQRESLYPECDNFTVVCVRPHTFMYGNGHVVPAWEAFHKVLRIHEPCALPPRP